MRIGIVTTWFERGAALVSRQYRDTLAGEHEVHVYARGGEEQPREHPEWSGERVTWAPSRPTHGNTAFKLSHFKRWVEQHRFDLVLFNEQQWWPPVLLCQDLGVLTAAYVDYYTQATVPLFANYDLLLCHTQRHQSVFHWHPACHYLAWGTRTDVFRPRGPGGPRAGPLTFFHNAGFRPQRKGTGPLLDAFHALEGDARLVVHTQVPLSDTLPERRTRIDELQRSGRLVVEQRTVPAPGLYHLGDVYVYPSRLEGIGLTVAEALCCGLPAIVPDCAPMNEFVPESAGRLVRVERLIPREDGYYWPQCVVDGADLTRQMAWYLANRARLPELQAGARRHAEHHLDWAVNGRPLSAILAAARPLAGEERRAAREAALDFERRRVDPRLFFPRLVRLLIKSADFLQPLTARYSGRRGGPAA